MSTAFQLLIAVSFALPSLQMAAKQFRIWRAPLDVVEGRWVSHTVTSTGLEFLHLLGTLAVLAVLDQSSAGRAFAVVGVVVMHVLLVLLTTRAFTDETGRELKRFVAMRSAALLVGGAGGAFDFLLLHTYLALGIFFAVMFLSLMLPVPRWGVTEPIAARLVDPKAVGVWDKQPHRGLFAGAFYFLVLGLFELFFLSWVDPTEFMNR